MKSLIRFFWIPCLGILLLLSSGMMAQTSYWTVKGKVLEANQTPLEFVNVYVNNTSIGTATDAQGVFTLRVPKSIQKVELVASSVGYNTLKKVFTPAELAKSIIFYLESSNILNEIKVSAKRDKDWKRKWRIFREGILGQSEFTNDCEILNPDAIRLEYDKDKKVVASAIEPIYIQNDALGYKIRFQLKTFISDGSLTFFSGDKFFEELTPKDEKQQNKWKKYRKRAYRDSFRNFLVSLSKNKLEENNFVIFEMAKVKQMYFGRTTVAKELADESFFTTKASNICTFDSVTKVYRIHASRPIMVFMTKYFNPVPTFADYPYKFSQIVLTNGYTEFSANGWLTKPNGIILRDHWGLEGFSNFLPDDYQESEPSQGDTDHSPAVLAANNPAIDLDNKPSLIEGKVVDTQNKPLASAKVFVNHTSVGTTTNAEGKFSLTIPGSIKETELLITADHFQTSKINTNPKEKDEELIVSMLPGNEPTETVKQDKDWKKRWELVEKTIFGNPNTSLSKSNFSEYCKVLNPEVVKIAFDDAKNMIATASSPLIIKNEALGYQITYQLKQFSYDGKEATASGDSYFEKLTPIDKKQNLLWKVNQKKTYQESFRYFLVSLSQNKLAENGFAAFKMARILEKYDKTTTVRSQLADSSFYATTAKTLCMFDAETNRYYLHSEYPLLVFLTKRPEAVPLTLNDYPYKRSQVVLPNVYLEFTPDGTITKNNAVEMRDFWGTEGVANTLPTNFVPDTNGIEKLDILPIESIPAKSFKPDSINQIIAQGIQYNKTYAKEQDSKSLSNLTLDYSIKINESDRSFTIYDLLRRIPGIQIKYNAATGNYVVSFLGYTSLKGNANPAALSLDGYFTDNAEQIANMLSSININEVETVGAIKYGGGAFFGARGGNGIIVITTKK